MPRSAVGRVVAAALLFMVTASLSVTSALAVLYKRQSAERDKQDFFLASTALPGGKLAEPPLNQVFENKGHLTLRHARNSKLGTQTSRRFLASALTWVSRLLSSTVYSTPIATFSSTDHSMQCAFCSGTETSIFLLGNSSDHLFEDSLFGGAVSIRIFRR